MSPIDQLIGSVQKTHIGNQRMSPSDQLISIVQKTEAGNQLGSAGVLFVLAS
jgi:hypothetical protein